MAPMYATPADLAGTPTANGRFEADFVAQRAAPEGQRVTGELLRLTIAGGDRSAYGAEDIAAADAALARINDALSDADAIIDGYLADQYTLPLDPVPRLIKRYACDIARYLLWGAAAVKDGEEERAYNNALTMLRQTRDGKLTLGVQPRARQTPDRVAPELVDGGERLFTRDTLRGL